MVEVKQLVAVWRNARIKEKKIEALCSVACSKIYFCQLKIRSNLFVTERYCFSVCRFCWLHTFQLCKNYISTSESDQLSGCSHAGHKLQNTFEKYSKDDGNDDDDNEGENTQKRLRHFCSHIYNISMIYSVKGLTQNNTRRKAEEEEECNNNKHKNKENKNKHEKVSNNK